MTEKRNSKVFVRVSVVEGRRDIGLGGRVDMEERAMEGRKTRRK